MTNEYLARRLYVKSLIEDIDDMKILIDSCYFRNEVDDYVSLNKDQYLFQKDIRKHLNWDDWYLTWSNLILTDIKDHKLWVAIREIFDDSCWQMRGAAYSIIKYKESSCLHLTTDECKMLAKLNITPAILMVPFKVYVEIYT